MPIGTHPWDTVLIKDPTYSDYPVKVCIHDESIFNLVIIVEHYVKPEKLEESSRGGGQGVGRHELREECCSQ